MENDKSSEEKVESSEEEIKEYQDNMMATSNDLDEIQEEQAEKDSEEDSIASGLEEYRDNLTEEGTEEESFDDSDDKSDSSAYLMEKIKTKYAKSSDSLKKILQGKITLNVEGDSKPYSYSFSSGELDVTRDEVEKSECTISISDESLQRLIRRRLNPQIAIMSKQIKISGDMSLGMYFFNLFR